MLSTGSIFLLLPDEAPSLWIMIVEMKESSCIDPNCQVLSLSILLHYDRLSCLRIKERYRAIGVFMIMYYLPF